jgi:hypothetical protein
MAILFEEWGAYFRIFYVFVIVDDERILYMQEFMALVFSGRV